MLIVLPFRDSALKVVQMMMKLLSDKEVCVWWPILLTFVEDFRHNALHIGGVIV